MCARGDGLDMGYGLLIVAVAAAWNVGCVLCIISYVNSRRTKAQIVWNVVVALCISDVEVWNAKHVWNASIIDTYSKQIMLALSIDFI